MKKSDMIEVIHDVGSSDLEFLGNELNLMDVFWDAMLPKLEKMKKEEIKELYEKAKKSRNYDENYYEDDDD